MLCASWESVPVMNFWSPRSSASSDVDYVQDSPSVSEHVPSVEPQSSSVIHRGWLFKRGAGGFFHRSTWKARFCIVTSASIRYYNQENETKKGELDLSGCTHKCIEVLPRKALRSSHPTLWRFAVHTPKRRMVFSASTETEMNEWIRSIHMAMALQKNNVHVVQQIVERQTAPAWYLQRDMLLLPLDPSFRTTTCSSRGYSSVQGRRTRLQDPRLVSEVEF
ncbi:hypothetical protein ACHHYP_10465 [Achlya hypogyna]|uniref:PH domain-containing protein n=1 Tax=Achlya hypogyna TaxID=1202772 RepID=A0A1V9YLE6_ACHHY|nr:hypothetical protein ACHHYP_10465 [Achlya hypogyna]